MPRVTKTDHKPEISTKTVVYHGRQEHFAFRYHHDSSLTVTDRRTGACDTLRNVETLQFKQDRVEIEVTAPTIAGITVGSVAEDDRAIRIDWIVQPDPVRKP